MTDEVITKKGGLGLGGLTSAAAPDLNDNDDGLIGIAEAWGARCGVVVGVITD